jgi:hypothetical protein
LVGGKLLEADFFYFGGFFDWSLYSCWVDCHFGLSFKIAQQWSILKVDLFLALNNSLALASFKNKNKSALIKLKNWSLMKSYNIVKTSPTLQATFDLRITSPKFIACLQDVSPLHCQQSWLGWPYLS